MVAHETPSPDLQLMLGRILAQELEIDQPIGAILKYDLAAIAALRDVMRNPLSNHARDSSHLLISARQVGNLSQWRRTQAPVSVPRRGGNPCLSALSPVFRQLGNLSQWLRSSAGSVARRAGNR